MLTVWYFSFLLFPNYPTNPWATYCWFTCLLHCSLRPHFLTPRRNAKVLIEQHVADCNRRKARDMVNQIINKGQGVPDAKALGQGLTMEEILIEGYKVGLIIGKGGENIKQLQVRKFSFFFFRFYLQ